MIEKLLVAELKTAQQKVANETMRLTSGDVFALGVQIGMYRGLEHAEAILQRLLDDEDRAERGR